MTAIRIGGVGVLYGVLLVLLSTLLVLPSCSSAAFVVHVHRLPPCAARLTPSVPSRATPAVLDTTFRRHLTAGLRRGATMVNCESPSAVPQVRVRVRSWQTVSFVGAIAVTYWSAAWATDLTSQVRLLAPAVGLLGLPHGAFDLALAQELSRKDRLLPFALSYMGLAGLVIWIWRVAPVGALGAFLAYAAFHFASDWNDQSMAWRIGGGLSVVGAPALWKAPEVAQIFAILTGHADISVLVALVRLAGVIGMASIVVASLSRPALRSMVELAALCVAAAWLPALLYFITYFCFLHSPRHLCEVFLGVSGQRRRALVQATTITIATLLGASLALFRLTTIRQVELNEATIRTVFTGLAALTVPHMLLVEWWGRRKRRNMHC